MTSSRSHLRLTCCALFWLLTLNHIQAAALTKILDNGSDSERINIVVLSEGYTAADLSSFQTDAQNILNEIFGEEPFTTYKPYFNAYTLAVESSESGADRPSLNTYVDTAFDATFETSGISQLLTVNSSKVYTTLNAHYSSYDIVLVLVNSDIYGGSGGTFAIASLHPNAGEIMEHETGHSFGNLADEYDTYYAAYTPQEMPNNTQETNRAAIKWRDWIEGATPIPTPENSATYGNTVGLFEGSMYRTSGWYRPHYNSKMKSLGRPWGQVNVQQLVLEIYNLIPPFQSQTPLSPSLSVNTIETLNFSAVGLLQPNGHELTIQWLKDDVVIPGENSSSLSIASTEFGEGSHTLTLRVSDPTDMVRTDPSDLLSKTFTWLLNLSNQSAFDQWLLAYTSLSPQDQDAQADPDGDGLANLWEYVYSDPSVTLSLSPETNDASMLLPQASQNESGQLVLTLTLPDSLPSDITITIEGSEDLSSWSQLSQGTDYTVSSDAPNANGNGTSNVRYTILDTSQDWFIRAVATEI